LANKARTARKQQRQEFIESPEGHYRAAYQAIRGPPAPSLQAVLIEDASMPGNKRYTTHPHEVDKAAREAWGRIYQGNFPDPAPSTQNFFKAYDKFIFKSPQEDIAPITGEQLMSVSLGAANTAAGPDAWSPADFKLISLNIF
jgi:hypothetical protein